MPEADAKRATRSNWLRNADADKLQSALGRLPRRVERPGLVILVGLPGSGKSHFAREIALRVPAVILDSDALRQVLYAQSRHTENEHRRLFPALHVLTERLLSRGNNVIVDATNLKEANRRTYHQIGERHGANVVVVRVWAPKRVIRERLLARDVSRNPLDRSTATLAVYETMLADVEPIRRRHVSVNTSKDSAPSVDTIIALLQASKVK